MKNSKTGKRTRKDDATAELIDHILTNVFPCTSEWDCGTGCNQRHVAHLMASGANLETVLEALLNSPPGDWQENVLASPERIRSYRIEVVERAIRESHRTKCSA